MQITIIKINQIGWKLAFASLGGWGGDKFLELFMSKCLHESRFVIQNEAGAS